MSSNSPYIIMDFHKKRFQFEQPLHVWQTHKADEIEAIFTRVQEAIDNQQFVVGYVAYEAAPAFDNKLNVRQPDETLPLVWFAAFNKPAEDKAAFEKGSYTVSDWRSDTNREAYAAHIEDIHEAIARGETYQVNYTTRLHADFEGDDLAFYEDLREVQQAEYSAFMNLGRYRILSVSPELFFHWTGDQIRTKPMKGTLPKSESKRALFESEKNRAENVMIVDLLRNDISRIAKIGSVSVPKLFEIEEYPTLYQMTSTVEATILPGTTLFNVFQAMFPCGSITGAPKISTMDIIASLEQTPRHIYCGAIGLAVPGEGITFNVAIRTVLLDTETHHAVYGVGGGIIWDSTAEEEYAEMGTKAKVLTHRS